MQQLGLTLPVEGTGRKRRMGPAVRAFQTPDGRRAPMRLGALTLRAVILPDGRHGRGAPADPPRMATALVQRLLPVLDDREAAEAGADGPPLPAPGGSPAGTVMLGLKDLMEHLPDVTALRHGNLLLTGKRWMRTG